MQEFKDKFGLKINPIDPIFPVLTGDKKSREYKFHGTGFFINPLGGFVTAKHVLYNSDGSHIDPFFAITTHKGQQYIRYLYKSFPHPKADICYGIMRNEALLDDKLIKIDFKTPIMQILENEPVKGDTIQTFAYPNSKIETNGDEQFGDFKGEWFKGKVLEIIPYRDSVFYPYQVFESSMNILPGASGGPVMKDAYVIGVNSSALDLGETDDNISYITPIKFALEIDIELNGRKFKLGEKQNKSIRKI